MILLIDNYDSFVFNLARYVQELGHSAEVYRNDQLTLDDVRALSPSAIIISPGPGTPNDAGISETVIRECGPTIPVLGVCLGHQAIATAFGASLSRDSSPVHGRTSLIDHANSSNLFDALPNPLRVTRYHSLVVDEASLPDTLKVTSRLENRTIMSLEHTSYPIWGVQFHPESVLTTGGHQLLANFLRASSGLDSREGAREQFFDHSKTEQVGKIFPIARPASW